MSINSPDRQEISSFVWRSTGLEGSSWTNLDCSISAPTHTCTRESAQSVQARRISTYTPCLLIKLWFLVINSFSLLNHRLHNMKYNCPEIMGTEILKSELLTHRRPGLGSHLFLLSAVASIKTFCVVTNWMADVVYAMQGVPRWDNYVPPHPKGSIKYTVLIKISVNHF